MNNKKINEHNNNIRFILVEIRVTYDVILHVVFYSSKDV